MKHHDHEVYVLSKEYSRMGPDDHDKKDAWIEEFDGYDNIYFDELDEITFPKKVVFWANWTYDQTDLLSCKPNWPIFSPKLLKLFEDNKIPLRKFPITLIREGGGKKEVHEDYHVVQLRCHEDFLDLKDSIYTMDEFLPRNIEFINKLVLRRPLEGFPLVFRLYNKPTKIFVSMEMKQKLEQAGIKGIHFRTIDEVFKGAGAAEKRKMMNLD